MSHVRSRPSLSDDAALSARLEACRRDGRDYVDSVAGITVPAFVERSRRAPDRVRPPRSVAGITVPAFVERSHRQNRVPTVVTNRCRRDYGPGLR